MMSASDGKRREAFSFGVKFKGGNMAKHKKLVIKGGAHMEKKRKGGRKRRGGKRGRGKR
jgi:hypothetical protein